MLVGLGVSSISDVHLAYAQNVKTVEGYMEKVNNGELPVFKGHFMSQEDIEVREQILKVACQKYFDLGDISLDQSVLLETLLNDGLIREEKGRYSVTEMGNQYLRNICSLFDPNYGKKREGKVFSQAV
jgi:oxygen-independent coproporphyrinogen-3 oxidase